MEAARQPDVPYPRAVERFPVLRQSLLSTFDECGLSSHFELSYKRGWATHPQGRGRLFHLFAGEALRSMQAVHSGSIDVTSALGILEDVLTQRDADRVCPSCGSEKILPGLTARMERTCGSCGAMFETGFVNVPMREVKDLYMVVKKWASDNSFDIDRIVDVERRMAHAVRYTVDGVGVDRVLTGQPDVLILHPRNAEHMIVIDWKDTWGLPPASEISEGGYFQQRFYAWLVMHTFRKIEGDAQGVLRAPVEGAGGDGLAARPRPARRGVRGAGAAVRPGLRGAGAHADAGRALPLLSAAAEVQHPGVRPRGGRITDERQARQVAAQLLVAKRTVEKSERELRSWVEERRAGGREVSEGEADLRPGGAPADLAADEGATGGGDGDGRRPDRPGDARPDVPADDEDGVRGSRARARRGRHVGGRAAGRVARGGDPACRGASRGGVMRTLRWRVIERDGRAGEEIEFETDDKTAAYLERLYRAIVSMTPGTVRSRRINELSVMMNMVAVFADGLVVEHEEGVVAPEVEETMAAVASLEARGWNVPQSLKAELASGQLSLDTPGSLGLEAAPELTLPVDEDNKLRAGATGG
jgi:hypothetical protein